MTGQAASNLAGFAAILAGASGGGLVVVSAHPDDETIGIGGHLPLLSGVAIVHITDGAPRSLHDARRYGFSTWEAYAEARRAELAEAVALAGVDRAQLLQLGIADQDAARQLPEITARLVAIFREHAPRLVLTHAFEGGHPDHDAAAFSVHAACRILALKGHAAPAIIEMPSYHLGPDGPVRQRFAAPEGTVLTKALSADQQALKQRMLACFRTQQQTLAPFTSAEELFRQAPRYDFRKLPNGGRLLYETFDSGLEGPAWKRLARNAEARLETELRAC
jgi:LmbE family N-acetylglucosaminyl deacetylase